MRSIGRRGSIGGRERHRTLWVQEAIKHPGALHKQLGVPPDERLPVTLLRAIKGSPVGSRIVNPTKMGHANVTVTRLLKRRAVLALNLKEI